MLLLSLQVLTELIDLLFQFGDASVALLLSLATWCCDDTVPSCFGTAPTGLAWITFILHFCQILHGKLSRCKRLTRSHLTFSPRQASQARDLFASSTVMLYISSA